MTGGSQGLGLSVAILLAQKGADVTLVARNIEKLDNAIQELEVRQSGSPRVFYSLNSLKPRNIDNLLTKSFVTIPLRSMTPKVLPKHSKQSSKHSENDAPTRSFSALGLHSLDIMSSTPRSK